MDYSKLSTEQLEELAASNGDVSKISTSTLETLSAAPEPTAWETAKDIGGTALDYGLRGLDYAGGLARTGAYGAYDELAQMLGSEDKIDSAKAFEMALKGQAPTSSENLDALGVDKMGTMNLPILGEVSTRGAIGLASDIALDPLTYATFGASAASKVAKGGSKLQKVARPLAGIESNMGRKLYESGLKNVDEVVSRFGSKGSKDVSETLLKNGISGSAKGIDEAAAGLANSLKSAKDEIIEAATAAGGSVDAGDVLGSFRNKVGKIAQGKNIKTVKSQADSMLKEIDEILEFGSKTDDVITNKEVLSKVTGPKGSPVTQYDLITGKPIKDIQTSVAKGSKPLTVAEADTIKTQLYNVMRNDAYSDLAKTSAGTKIQKEVAKLFKDSIENAVEKTTGQGTLLKNVNKDLGVLLSAKKPLAQAAKSEGKKNAISAVDGMLAGAALVGGGGMSAAPLLLKKTADVLKGTRFRTGVGKALYNDPGVADALLRRGNTIGSNE